MARMARVVAPGVPHLVMQRGNRRHRKMQKSVYRVRTRQSLHRRMALDLLRERQAEGRSQATATLHAARAASG